MNKCPKCGVQTDGTFCPECGTVTVKVADPVVNPAPTFTPPAQPVRTEITEEMLPERFKPLGAWAYFGLTLLFAVPIVGLVFLIVFSFNGSNVNRRSYARSYWCFALVSLIILVIAIVVCLIATGSVEGLTDLFKK